MCSLCTNIPPLPLWRPLPVKCTYPYFKFGRLNAADINKKLIQIQRQTLRTDPPHCIAMGTKMAVAFTIIFTAHVEKQLLHASHFSKRFIDDIFSVWTLPETEINNFIDFANSSHSTIKFTLVKTDCFDDVSLIRKRWSSSGEHSLRSVVNAVRYVVRMNSRACLCY